jgi:hypothetical protein
MSVRHWFTSVAHAHCAHPWQLVHVPQFGVVHAGAPPAPPVPDPAPPTPVPPVFAALDPPTFVALPPPTLEPPAPLFVPLDAGDVVVACVPVVVAWVLAVDDVVSSPPMPPCPPEPVDASEPPHAAATRVTATKKPAGVRQVMNPPKQVKR